MNLTLPQIGRLCWQTLTEPDVVARRLLGLQLGLGSGAEAVVLVAALNVVVTGLLQTILPVDTSGQAVVVISPLGYAAIMIGAILLVALTVLVAGRALGGRGRLDEAVVLIAWLEFVAIGVALVQALFLLVLPVFGVTVFYLGLALLFWAMINFVKELHGFANRAKAALAFVGGIFVLGLVLGIILSLFNISPVIGAI